LLITVTGGIGSGKTRFALGYAAQISREGIYLSTGDHDPVITGTAIRSLSRHFSREWPSPDGSHSPDQSGIESVSG